MYIVCSRQVQHLASPPFPAHLTASSRVRPPAHLACLQGGTVMSWIDICAGLAAKTFARGPCVTASVDAVHFLRPCHVSLPGPAPLAPSSSSKRKGRAAAC